MYVCRHFPIQELVPEAVFRAHAGNEAALWRIFDTLTLVSADRLRDRYGPATVNNWHIGGTMQFCGLRPWDCPVGALLSLHKFARALDLHFKLVQAEEIRLDMRQNPHHPAFEFILRCEAGVSWLHVDRANVERARRESGIVFF